MGTEDQGTDKGDTFSVAAIGELEKELHVEEFNDQLKLELNKLTAKYRPVAKSIPSKLSDAPSDLDLSKQIQWFEDNTIKPTQTLLKAFTAERYKMRTAMSPDLDGWIDIENLVPALEKLLDDADAVYVELDQQLSHRITNREQLQYEVASALYEMLSRNLGDAFLTRGVETVDIVLRVACGEILGHREQMNSILKAIRLLASKR